MNSFEEKLLFGAVAVVGGYLLLKKAGSLISNAVPPVVKEGAEASGVLAENTYNMIFHPLDAFGISAAPTVNGTPYWIPATPQENTTADPVSNNDTGINFNYF